VDALYILLIVAIYALTHGLVWAFARLGGVE
jgi:hypothetical protein